jgi:hypothetical protein
MHFVLSTYNAVVDGGAGAAQVRCPIGDLRGALPSLALLGSCLLLAIAVDLHEPFVLSIEVLLLHTCPVTAR